MSTKVLDAIFWIAVAACAVAQIFILRAVFRVSPRRSSEMQGANSTASFSDDASVGVSFAQASGVPAPKRGTEILWVLLPVVLLALAFFGAWRVMHPTFAEFIRNSA